MILWLSIPYRALSWLFLMDWCLFHSSVADWYQVSRIESSFGLVLFLLSLFSGAGVGDRPLSCFPFLLIPFLSGSWAKGQPLSFLAHFPCFFQFLQSGMFWLGESGLTAGIAAWGVCRLFIWFWFWISARKYSTNSFNFLYEGLFSLSAIYLYTEPVLAQTEHSFPAAFCTVVQSNYRPAARGTE